MAIEQNMLRACHLNIKYNDSDKDETRAWRGFFNDIQNYSKRATADYILGNILLKNDQTLLVLITGRETFLSLYDPENQIMRQECDFGEVSEIPSLAVENLMDDIRSWENGELKPEHSSLQSKWGKQLVFIRDSEFKEEQGLKSFMEGKIQWYRNTAPKNSDFFSSKISDQVYSDVKQLKDIYNTAKIQANMEGNRLYRGVLLKQFRGIDLGKSPILKEVHDSLIKGNFVKDIQKDIVR